jgi:hypothetical protein
LVRLAVGRMRGRALGRAFMRWCTEWQRGAVDSARSVLHDASAAACLEVLEGPNDGRGHSAMAVHAAEPKQLERQHVEHARQLAAAEAENIALMAAAELSNRRACSEIQQLRQEVRVCQLFRLALLVLCGC